MESELQEPNHPVLQLVSPEFETMVTTIYAELRLPPLRRDNLWEIFTALRNRLEDSDHLSVPVTDDEDLDDRMAQHQAELRNLRPLVDRNLDGEFPRYLGGVNGGQGIGNCLRCSRFYQPSQADPPFQMLQWTTRSARTSLYHRTHSQSL